VGLFCAARRPSCATPSPYTTLFRSDWYVADLASATTLRIADGGWPIEGGGEPLAVEPVVWSPDERFVFHRALVDGAIGVWRTARSEEHTSELQSRENLVCRLLLEKK